MSAPGQRASCFRRAPVSKVCTAVIQTGRARSSDASAARSRAQHIRSSHAGTTASRTYSPRAVGSLAWVRNVVRIGDQSGSESPCRNALCPAVTGNTGRGKMVRRLSANASDRSEGFTQPAKTGGCARWIRPLVWHGLQGLRPHNSVVGRHDDHIHSSRPRS